MKAPFRVPANTRIPLIVETLNRGLRGSRQISSKSKIKSRISSFARVGGDRPPSQRNLVPEFRRCEVALTPYDFVVKNSTFRIVPLPTDVAATARRAAASGAPDHAMVVADSPDGFPCRHCLRWARPGERMILFPYAAIPPGHPYSECGPIFVHAEPCERYARRANIRPTFAMVARFALTMQITI